MLTPIMFNLRHMWQGIQAITNYNASPPACDGEVSLLDELNYFNACFKAQIDMASLVTRCFVWPWLIWGILFIESTNEKLLDKTLFLVVGSENVLTSEETEQLMDWCKANLSLNVDITKELDVDFRRAWHHFLLNSNSSSVEIVKSPRFLGVHIMENLAPSQRRLSSISTSCRDWEEWAQPPPLHTHTQL